jgi:hypothetical protein
MKAWTWLCHTLRTWRERERARAFALAGALVVARDFDE